MGSSTVVRMVGNTGDTGHTVNTGDTGNSANSGHSVGIDGPGRTTGEVLGEALARERADGAGALREFLDSLDTAGRRESALALHRRICRRSDEETAGRALDALARQELGWSTAESDLLLSRLLGRDAEVAPHELLDSFSFLVPIALSAAEQAEDFDRTRVRFLRGIAEHLRVHRDGRFAALRDRMDALSRRPVPIVPGLLPRHLLDGLDDYGPAMRAAHPAALKGAGTVEFLDHCATLHRPRAPRNWRKRSAELLARAEGGAEVVRLLLEGIAAQPAHRVHELDLWGMDVPTLAAGGNTALVRGLLWAALDVDADWVVPRVGAVALHAGTGLGGSGGMCRSRPLATTAVAVLGACGDARGEEAVQWLGRLPRKVVNRAVAKGIAKALEEVSARSGVTPSMLRERGVATLGLDGRGVRETPLGPYTAELSVREPGTVALAFRSPEGRPLKTAPKEVREAHTEELKRVRAGLQGAQGPGRRRALPPRGAPGGGDELAGGGLAAVLRGPPGHGGDGPRAAVGGHGGRRGAVDRGPARAHGRRLGPGGRGRHRASGRPRRPSAAVASAAGRGRGGRRVAGRDGGPGGGPAVQAGLPRGVPAHPGRVGDRPVLPPLRGAGAAVRAGAGADDRARLDGEPPGVLLGRLVLGDDQGAAGPGGRPGVRGDGLAGTPPRRAGRRGGEPGRGGRALRDGPGVVRAALRCGGRAGAWSEAALTDVPALTLSEAFRDVDLFVQVASAEAGAAQAAESAPETETAPAPR